MISNQPSQRVLDPGFRLVNLASDTRLLPAIERVVKNSITPLYGDEATLLSRINTGGSGTRCEVLLKHDQAVGFIIYRTELKACLGRNVKDSLELCHLELVDPKDAGAGYRSQLYDRVEEIAKEFRAATIHAEVANRDKLRGYLLDREFNQDDRDIPDTKAGRPALLLYRQMAHNYYSNNGDINHNNNNLHSNNNNNNNNNNNKAEQGPTEKKRTYEVAAPKEESKKTKVEVRQITLPRQYIHQIRSGAKTIEGRINSGQFANLRTGDKIRFFYNQNPSDDVICEVTALKRYSGFPAMLTAEGYKKCVPELTSYEAACHAYDKIPNYTSKAAQYGVVAIHLKKAN